MKENKKREVITMCEFLSWIKIENKVYFLTDIELKSERGKELKKYLGEKYDEDKKGHGAIRWYYSLPENVGENKENSDFSSPANFPVEIVKALKKGYFSKIGTAEKMLDLSALKKYEEIEQPAMKKYEEIRLREFWKLAKNPENRVEEWK